MKLADVHKRNLAAVSLALSGALLFGARSRSSQTTVTVALRVGADQQVSMLVQNTSDHPVSVRTLMALQRSTREGWVSDDRAPPTLELRSECLSVVPECRTLAVGETVRVVPWTGYNALIQCPRPTPSDFAAPAGRYRVTVSTCDGTRVFSSAPVVRASSEPR